LKHSQETARNLIDSYSAEYGGKYCINTEAYQRLLRLCDFADAFAKDCLADTVGINAIPSQLSGTVYINTDEVIFEHGRSHMFFDRIKDADFLGFSKAKNGMLQVRFGVNNLWVEI
jgi:hypothetical protein